MHMVAYKALVDTLVTSWQQHEDGEWSLDFGVLRK
jgi:hypothetical protein